MTRGASGRRLRRDGDSVGTETPSGRSHFHETVEVYQLVMLHVLSDKEVKERLSGGNRRILRSLGIFGQHF